VSLKRDGRTTCLFRDCEVVVTGRTDARIPWPRCRAQDNCRGGGPGLLVDEELARAVRHEAAAAEATVKALLADAGGKVPSCALARTEKARKGHLRSLIALECLDCCWQRREVALCPVLTCPLHPVRPYKAGA